MGGEATPVSGPDLRRGIPYESLREGEAVLGHADADPVLVIRIGADVFAVGATCTHYSGPLADGLVTGDIIRCPWHHACFSVRTGAAVAAPALNPLPRYRTAVWEGTVYVLDRDDKTIRPFVRSAQNGTGERMLIVGAGAAGHAAVETLRGEGYDGAITVIDPDADAPYDRPNLSKDYLAGAAPEEWLPLRPQAYYGEMGIERIVAAATELDVRHRTVQLSDGRTVRFDKLLLATGAAPVRIPVPGGDQSHVFTLRSLADCRALIDALPSTRHAVIAGASFIGLEATAALRTRGIDVTVVAPEQIPFARAFGDDLGTALRELHEQHGVQFVLGHTLGTILRDAVVLDDGRRIDAQLVLLATGVRPVVDLAMRAGLAMDNGVLVDRFLETSEPGIYAAGDIARYPLHGEQRVRIEHWVVAERQGQTAARNMLGQQQAFTAVPFFWTQQYDTAISYVGHAAGYERIEVDGSIPDRDCTIRYIERNAIAAVATINRDIDSLRAELALERAYRVDAGMLDA